MQQHGLYRDVCAASDRFQKTILSHNLTAAAVAAVLAAGFAGSAEATTMSVGTAQYSTARGDCIVTTTGPAPVGGISATYESTTNGYGSALVTAYAGAGALGGSASATSQGTSRSGNNQIGGCFRAVAVYDDIMITSDTVATGTEVTVRVNARLTGGLSGAVGPIGTASGAVAANLTPLGNSSLGDHFDHNLALGFDSSSVEGVNTLLTSGSFAVQVNVPFNVQLDLYAVAFARSGATLDGAGSSKFGSLFADTFSFVTDMPVFDLPDGFSAMSASANIVDNRFTLAATDVPEPAGALLFFAGLAGLGYASRRRRLVTPERR